MLIPDFQGKAEPLQTVLDAGPDILNHNTETVPRLYRFARSGGRYPRTLELLDRARAYAPHIPTKTGLMVGLGEEWDEVVQTMRDLRGVGVDILTIGQYLRPGSEQPADDALLHAGRIRAPEAHRARPGLRPRRIRPARAQLLSRARTGRRARRNRARNHGMSRVDRTPRWLRSIASASTTSHRACNHCTRLRTHCTRIAQEKRAAYRDETYWGRPVPGFGDPRARLLVLGLAPGAHGANRTGRMFTGDSSGAFLMRAMHAAGFANIPLSRDRDDGLELHDAYILAAVRCAPPDNKPTTEEIAACQPHLDGRVGRARRASRSSSRSAASRSTPTGA